MTPLNSSFQLPCGATLNNRIAKAALTERIAKADRLPNERHFNLYEHWARNGAGMLLTGNIQVDKRYLESTGNVVVEKNTPIEAFQTWTQKVNRYGNHFWAQISHAGRQSSRFSTLRPVSASNVQLKKMGLFAKPVPLTESGIEDVIERFVFTADFCKRAGFTGVQFHAAHGYLLSQFLSPKTNIRDDQWGGSVENRARILFEIVERTRKVVGTGFPISVKLNSADFQRGGFNEEDSKFVIKALEERGVDLLEISGGTYEMSAMLLGVEKRESTKQREAYFLDFAKEIRKDCKMPLMVTGGFRTLEVCEEALTNDELDIVGFGRPFLLTSSFPKEFLNGSAKKIDPPSFKILDKNNADAAEAGFYDLQIKRLADGKPLKFDYSSVKIATHIPRIEMSMGIRNWMFG